MSQNAPPARGYTNPIEWREAAPLTPLPSEDGTWARLIVTFGVQYAREDHPSLPWAHPDGYLQVQYRIGADAGASWQRARLAVLSWTAGAFATSYNDLEEALMQYVPWGELALMVLP